MKLSLRLLLFMPASCCLACTTILVGKAASKDGTVLVSHSNDGEGDTDPRLVKVEAKDHDVGSKRPIFYSPESYPRYVGTARGIPAYFPKPGQQEMEPIGYIPQVNHTFAYLEETYGAINEHGVSVGESTCSGIWVADAIGHGGEQLFSIDELSRVAMERATTAREAVSLMGALSEQYGFYGAADSFEGGSESLLVGDADEGGRSSDRACRVSCFLRRFVHAIP